MKIAWIFLFLFGGLYSFGQKEVGIEFLSKDSAALAILDESYEPYFSQLQLREISVFVGEEIPYTNLPQAREYAKERFAAAVIDFTKDEKDCIAFVLAEVVRILKENRISLMAEHKWTFIKIEDWLCGGFAHANVKPEESIQLDQVSNPDAPVADWLVPDEKNDDHYFWVITMLKETDGIPIMGRDFTNKVFIAEKADDVHRVKRDENGKLMSTTLSEIDFYVNSFPENRGIDHPNEISAYMFADYFVSLVNDTKAFDDVQEQASQNSELFLEWINEEMKK